MTVPGGGSADGFEVEHERIFREAQRAADTIFSHYQLSQLLATHARSASMASAVLDELIHVCDAASGGIWLTQPAGSGLQLVARAGDQSLPRTEALRAGSRGAWVIIELEEVGYVALTAGAHGRLDAGARRFLSLVRHELAGAFRSSQLAETIEHERTELSAIIGNASDAILVFDSERRVTRVNPAAERVFGQEASAIAGRGCGELYRCDVVEALGRCAGCPVARVLGRGEPVDGEERVVLGRSGASTAVIGSYTRTSAADGRAGAVAILRDTSELARLAELRRGFLASVSHELRTPIALIKGYVETLLHLAPDPATTRRYLERMDETTSRLGHLVEQILDATQLSAGQLVLDLEEVDLAMLMRETIDQLAVGSPAPYPTLEVVAPIQQVLADRQRVRQVLENLVVNAQKYGNQTPITVRLEASDGAVEIRISDGGIGIPADERELIFEQFHRARNARDLAISGSGLGLAISRRIVEAHGGTLGFGPGREAGATAVVRLPGQSPATTAEAEPLTAARSER